MAAASAAMSNAIGRLLRNLNNPKWVATEGAKSAITTFVVNPAGQKVSASIMHHLHHEDEHGNDIHIGDAYKCTDGHEYMVTASGTYRHDKASDSWVKA